MSSIFRVGDRVRVPLGQRRMFGVITEDLGAIGLRGRHLFQVQVSMDPFEPASYQLPEDEIEPVNETGAHTSHLDQQQIESYLINGGLIAVLRSNLAGGRNPPRVWLCPDSVGNVTHTFDQDRGVVGGEVVPFMAIHDDKIFTPKREAVLSFLQSFNLDRSQVERIAGRVGTAP